MLAEFVLAPPLPALIGLAILLGVVELGWRITPVLGLGGEPVDYGAGFIVATAALCAVLHPLVWIGVPHLVAVLRAIGWTIGAISLLSLPAWLRRARVLAAALAGRWRELATPDRVLAILIGVILAAYFLIVLGPACDVDSLDYHLGALLDWMLHGSIYPRWDWIQAHLVGIGEMISMMGLAAGTDGLGALFEFAGLLIAVAAALTFAIGARQRLMGALLIIGCPVMLELAIWQKPELLPAAAMTVALVLIAREWQSIRATTLTAAFICVGFAAACKYSFILSAPVVAAAGLVAGYRARRLRHALIVGGAAIIALPLQVWLRNYLLYGDPLSPMLEFLKAHPDPQALAWAQFLRGLVFYSMPPWRLLITFFFAIHPSQFISILGVGLFAIFLTMRKPRLPVILPATLALAVIFIAFAQREPRFFVELYLWIAVAAAGAPEGTGKAVIKWLLAIQSVEIAAIAIYFAAVLFPGALTTAWRDYAMERAGFYYDECRYLNSRAPDGIVLTTAETHALIRPPFVVLSEVFEMKDGPASPQIARVKRYLSDGPATIAYMQLKAVQYFLAQDPGLAPCFADPIADGVPFIHHPLRGYAPQDAQIWQLFRLKRGCGDRRVSAQAVPRE